MPNMYLVLVEGNPLLENGKPKEFLRNEAVRVSRELGGKFTNVFTDSTAIKRRTFRLSDSEMNQLGLIAKYMYNTSNKSYALKRLISSAYEEVELE